MAFFVAAGAMVATTTGCELIAAVDREKIPGAGGSTSTAGAGGTGGVTGGTGGVTGGTGGTGGVTGGGGTGGSTCGAAMECAAPGDCGAPASDCVDNTCDNGCCGTKDKDIGAACGANSDKFCDGNGTCVECIMDADCPDTGTVCATAVCKVDHTCDVTNADKGTACAEGNGVVCDGGGVCVAEHCMDTVQDSTETDKDCGGPDCAKCDNDQHCGGDGDCTSAHCLGNNPGTCVECIDPADCPATGNECVVATCASNACGTMNLDGTHTLSTGQTAHDCQKIVCNGAGGTVSADDATDLPVATTVCETSPACTGSPLAPHFTPANAGVDCTADNNPPKHLCGTGATAGTCVECNSGANCDAASCTGSSYTAAETCSAAGSCVAGATMDCSLNAVNKQCSASLGCVQCLSAANCAMQSCTGQTLHAAETCNGSGTCAAGATTDCSQNAVNKQCSSSLGCVQCTSAANCLSAGCTGQVYQPAQTCDGTGACQGGSTDCSANAVNKQCNAGLGCVQCTSSANCAAQTCVGQVLHAAETCNVGAGTCTAGATTDCSVNAVNKQCSNSLGCVQCTSAANCLPAGCTGDVYQPAQTCDGAGSCQGASMDCSVNAVNKKCNVAVGCVQCNGDPDCPASTCNLATHTCN